MINLIANAINYNNKENIILEFGCSEFESHYQFYLKDNGKGIPEDKFESIFGIFTTIGEKDRFNRKGTGIGLATVKKLV